MKALAEARRLLKSGGSLLFMEHGLAPDPIFKMAKSNCTMLEKIGGGCNLNRNIEALIIPGFKFKDLEKKYIKGPKIASFLLWRGS